MASNMESSLVDKIIAAGTGLDSEPDILILDSRPDVLETDAVLEADTESETHINVPENKDEDVELSPEGILDEETIMRGLSNIGPTANGVHHAYLNISIPGFSLVNIDKLSEYQHLQKVEIPHNNITDLSPLGKLRHLLILDASHNKIEKLLDFEPLVNLQEVNLAWNSITEMRDLSAYRLLKKLILDNNSIRVIHGLLNCKRLKHLSLAHNQIKMIQGLDDLPIQYLNLSHNQLKVLSDLQSLKYLQELNLLGNCVRSLQALSNNLMLESLDLESNEVIDIVEMNHIRHIKTLRVLNLLHNPIQELPDYRLCVLFRISRLVVLDRQTVHEQEKVAAINMFQPPMEVIAAQDHVLNVVYSFLQPSKVWHSTLPNIEAPYPMLVLVGPQGSGKKDLARKLVDEFGEYFGHGISHSTKRPRLVEKAGIDYHFVSLEEFKRDVKMGKFIETFNYGDYWFGLQMEAVENVAREGLACVVHMELEGVLTLKKTHFEPRYVLIIPLSSKVHEKRLREKRVYKEIEIYRILKRSEMYIQQNQDHPGFFDMLICSDDITEAYMHLRKLVMDYLGISSIVSASTTDANAMTSTHYTVEQMPAATRRSASNIMRVCSWSKHSVSESPSQGSGQTVRGFVEEESIKRRYSAAKDIVTGYVPPLTERLGIKYSRTSDKRTDFSERRQQKVHSATASYSGHGVRAEVVNLPVSPDSSYAASFKSSISDLESAAEPQKGYSEKYNNNMNSRDTLLSEKVDPLVLIDEPGCQSAPVTYLSYTSVPCPNSKNTLSRPGSDRHAVLPPIQNIAV